MRTLLLAALAFVSLVSMNVRTDLPDAKTVVCTNGVYRAGCAGPNGAVVVRRPYYRRGVVVRRYWTRVSEGCDA